MYGSDPFAYNFEAALANAIERKRAYQRKSEAAQQASERKYAALFTEGRLVPKRVRFPHPGCYPQPGDKADIWALWAA